MMHDGACDLIYECVDVAVCCSVLRCSVLQCVALQCVAVCYSELQCVAVP